MSRFRCFIIFGFISILLFSDSKNANNTLDSFGFYVPNDSAAFASDHPHIITVWYNSIIYRCSITPSQRNTNYNCDLSSQTSIIGNYSDNTYTKVLIENDDGNSAVMDDIWIKTSENTIYGISGNCQPSTITYSRNFWSQISSSTCPSGYKNYQWLCVNSDTGECRPYKQILYFNTSLPTGTYITNALWEDAVNINVPTYEPTTPSPSTFNPQTPYFTSTTNTTTSSTTTTSSPANPLITSTTILYAVASGSWCYII